jgi:Ca-activated chloride channel homolog
MRRSLSLLLPLLLVACAKHVREEPLPVAPPSGQALERIELSGSRVAGAPPPAPAAPALVRDTPMPMSRPAPPADAGGYEPQHEGPVVAVAKTARVADTPVSTFAIDVDTGSYTRVRQMLRAGRLPPPYAVRTEEFVNYFDHHYPRPPSAEPPFSVTTEIAPAPWQPQRHLLLVGLKGYEVAAAQLPPANLVLLVDTSGSMASADKMPLVKAGLSALVQRLRPQDRVAIVSYAGEAGLRLPSTPGDQQAPILQAIDDLVAAGSTHGSAGIQLAYEVARQHFIAGGINRVILATDGDFNVGTTSTSALKELVAEQRASGIALTTLGVGANHYNDALSEQLANVGNGNHAFIDDEAEAQRVLVRELTSTLFTIAGDVKVQLEFNPRHVAEYRLLGYDNRLLSREQFADDSVDAGEIGAGHSVTAVYELVLVGSGAETQPPAGQVDTPLGTHELARLRLRYKHPRQAFSRPIEHAIGTDRITRTPSPRLAFAAAVVGFAERLRRAPGFEDVDWRLLWDLANAHAEPDPHGERAELADLVELAAALSGAGM